MKKKRERIISIKKTRTVERYIKKENLDKDGRNRKREEGKEKKGRKTYTNIGKMVKKKPKEGKKKVIEPCTNTFHT